MKRMTTASDRNGPLSQEVAERFQLTFELLSIDNTVPEQPLGLHPVSKSGGHWAELNRTR